MKVKHKFEVTVKRSQWLPTPEGGKTEQLPNTQEWVEVEVDFETLAKQLGPKACRSTGGKSIEAGGAVVVRKMKASANCIHA